MLTLAICCNDNMISRNTKKENTTVETQWAGLIVDCALVYHIFKLYRQQQGYKLRLNVMEKLLQLHHNALPITRRLLVLHHAHFYHEEKEEQFIWPVMNESTETD